MAYSHPQCRMARERNAPKSAPVYSSNHALLLHPLYIILHWLQSVPVFVVGRANRLRCSRWVCRSVWCYTQPWESCTPSTRWWFRWARTYYKSLRVSLWLVASLEPVEETLHPITACAKSSSPPECQEGESVCGPGLAYIVNE